MRELEMKSLFFFVNNTNNLFPSFDYSSDSIPLGDSMDYCISGLWGQKESKFNFFILRGI